LNASYLRIPRTHTHAGMQKFTVEALPAGELGIVLSARTLLIAAAALLMIGAALGAATTSVEKRVRE